MTQLFYILLFLFVSYAYSQENNPWILGLGLNIVDNSGSRFNELLDIKNNWNFSRIVKTTVEKRYKYDFGAEASLTFNSFSRGKQINKVTTLETVKYFALDIMGKYYVTNYWQDARHAIYTGYLVGGWGGNFFNSVMNNTLNIGFGLNIRLKYNMWLNFQTLGKFSIDDNTPGNANHLQHSITLIVWMPTLNKKFTNNE